jgi:hypothetical protein
MKRLLLATAALASIGFATGVRAGSVTIDNLTITQIPAEDPGTFNNNPLGATTGYSSVSDWAYRGGIAFSTDGGSSRARPGPTPSRSPIRPTISMGSMARLRLFTSTSAA